MEIIQEEINNVIDFLKKDFLDPFPNNELKDFILNGSKLIRSKLAILYLKSQNVEINDDIYKILCAGELIHNASLLHDDVLDEADFRRGKVTIAKKFNSKLSILAGDYLLTFGIEKILELENNKILKLFKNCTQNMTLAEIKQEFSKETIPTDKEYLEICNGKTAQLFSAILQAVAEVCNLDVQHARIFGEKFGIYFQVKNDLNKDSAIADKKNGIKTAIDVLGIEKTNDLLDNYKEEMKELIKVFPDNIYKRKLEDLVFFYDGQKRF